MEMHLTRSIRISALSFLAMAAAANAESATQPFSLTPTTQPTTPANHYYDAGPSAYPVRANNYVVQPMPTYTPEPFDRNEFEFSIGGMGLSMHGDRGNDSLGFITFEGGWYFLPTLSVDLQAGFAPGNYSREDDNNNNGDGDHHHHNNSGVRAVEEMALLRWHFLTAGPLSLFVDGGVGGLYADPDFPHGGRRNNFLTAAGAGVTWEIIPHFYLAGGARAAWLYTEDDWRSDQRRHWSNGFEYYGQLTVMLP